jgi:hypothetical protein
MVMRYLDNKQHIVILPHMHGHVRMCVRMLNLYVTICIMLYVMGLPGSVYLIVVLLPHAIRNKRLYVSRITRMSVSLYVGLWLLHVILLPLLSVILIPNNGHVPLCLHLLIVLLTPSAALIRETDTHIIQSAISILATKHEPAQVQRGNVVRGAVRHLLPVLYVMFLNKHCVRDLITDGSVCHVEQTYVV